MMNAPMHPSLQTH